MKKKQIFIIKYLLPVLFVFNPRFSFSQKADSILVGSGGGFSGQTTVYSLCKKSIKKGLGTSTILFSSEKGYKPAVFKKISKEAGKIYRGTKGFSYPYNTYKFIEIYIAGKPIRYTWGDPRYTIPSTVETFYTHITSIINDSKINQK